MVFAKAYSARQFPQSNSKGHGRQASRFTVISNAAETEQSYDPFKASRFQHLDEVRGTERAKITIHPSCPSPSEQSQRIDALDGSAQISPTSEWLMKSKERDRYQISVSPRVFASRSSLASSTRSRSSGRHIRAPIRYKRGVSFAQVRIRPGGNHAHASGLSAGVRHSSYTGGNGDVDIPRSSPDSTYYIRSRKDQSVVSQPLLPIAGSTHTSQLWTDHVRLLSSSLAKDCEEAFNRSSVIVSSDFQRGNSTLAYFEPSNCARHSAVPIRASPISDTRNARHVSLSNRPLPPPPVRSESVNRELIEARIQAELRKSTGGEESPGYLDRMVQHIDRLIDPVSPVAAYTDYRASSAPVYGYTPPNRPLPSIHESQREEESPRQPTEFGKYKDKRRQNESSASRITSAPDPRNLNQDTDSFEVTGVKMRETIRVVNSPALDNAVQMPAPLTIRKKRLQAGRLDALDMSRVEQDQYGKLLKHQNSDLELRQQCSNDSMPDTAPVLSHIDGRDNISANGSISGTIVKKKLSLFKRSSKSSDENEWKMSIGGGHAISSQGSSIDMMRPEPEPLPILQKKKGLGLGKLFKRRSSKTDMTLGGKCVI